MSRWEYYVIEWRIEIENFDPVYKLSHFLIGREPEGLESFGPVFDFEANGINVLSRLIARLGVEGWEIISDVDTSMSWVTVNRTYMGHYDEHHVARSGRYLFKRPIEEVG